MFFYAGFYCEVGAVITLHNVCAIHWEMINTLEEYHDSLGDIMSKLGDDLHIGGSHDSCGVIL